MKAPQAAQLARLTEGAKQKEPPHRRSRPDARFYEELKQKKQERIRARHFYERLKQERQEQDEERKHRPTRPKDGIAAALEEYRAFKSAGLEKEWRERWKHFITHRNR